MTFDWKNEIERLLEMRECSKITLAGDLGISQAYLSEVLHGRRPASPVLRIRVLKALGVPKSDALLLELLADDARNEWNDWRSKSSSKGTTVGNTTANGNIGIGQTSFEVCLMNWAEIIQKLCKEGGLSVRTLSKEIGVSQPYLQDVANGKRPASPMLKLKLAQYFSWQKTPNLILDLLPDDVASAWHEWDSPEPVADDVRGCAMTETKIEKRVRQAFNAIAPNQTVRYDVLVQKTSIPRHKWVNFCNQRQGLGIVMLEKFLESWPEFSTWIITGTGMPSISANLEVIKLARNENGDVITNVPHSVSQVEKGTPPKFEFGRMGAGSKELAMNILFHVGGFDSRVADFFSHHLCDDIISGIPNNGGEIAINEIKCWIKNMESGIEAKKEEIRAYDELRKKHEEEVENLIKELGAKNGK